jgi:uncharacterized membrane protein (DUF485 family)
VLVVRVIALVIYISIKTVGLSFDTELLAAAVGSAIAGSIAIAIKTYDNKNKNKEI